MKIRDLPVGSQVTLRCPHSCQHELRARLVGFADETALKVMATRPNAFSDPTVTSAADGLYAIFKVDVPGFPIRIHMCGRISEDGESLTDQGNNELEWKLAGLVMPEKVN